MKAPKWLVVLFYMSLGGLATSIVFVAWPQPINTKEQARSVHAHSRSIARDLALGLELYLSDFDNRLPEGDIWIKAMRLDDPKRRNNISIPAARSEDGKQYCFALFEALSGVDASTVLNPETVPVFFETIDEGAPYVGKLDSLAWPHNGSVVVVFLDGHVESMPDAWQLETVKIEFADDPEDTEAD